MRAIALQEMFGGKSRLLFFRDLQAESVAKGEAKTIPLSDLSRLRETLDTGWQGVKLARVDEGWLVHLVLPPSPR